MASDKISVDEIMLRIKEEAGRLRARSIVDFTLQPLELASFTPWSEKKPLPVKGEYHLHELTAFDDKEFVRNVFRVLLKREADSAGERHFLEKLRDMSLTKTEIIWEVRYSEEGRKIACNIIGLEHRYDMLHRVKKLQGHPWA